MEGRAGDLSLPEHAILVYVARRAVEHSPRALNQPKVLRELGIDLDRLEARRRRTGIEVGEGRGGGHPRPSHKSLYLPILALVPFLLN